MIPDRHILGMRVDPLTNESATEQIMEWARYSRPRTVCVANVHMAMESFDNPLFQRVVNASDMVTPDGMPLVWALRLLGHSNVERVYGPDLVLHVCRLAEKAGLPVALYGGTAGSLEAFESFLELQFPDLDVVCRIAPPFRSLTDTEDRIYTDKLVLSGARIVFVGIGCPRQEIWMDNHRDRIPGVMLGVGAAFDFHSGRVRQAPSWIQNIGLEWAFRLVMEPRRLWKRYLKHNPRFVFYLVRQLLTGVKHRRGP